MRSQKTKEEIISTLNSFLEIIRKEYKAEVVGLFGSGTTRQAPLRGP